MRDPLCNFKWQSLAREYDQRCEGFNPNSAHLARLTKRPGSDRELHYRLVESFSPRGFKNDKDLVGTYEAMLYWKYYSQGTATRNIELMGRRNTRVRKRSAAQLRKMVDGL